MNNEVTQATGITSREFLDILPKKSKEDHAKDLEEMKRLGEKCKNIDLNPKVDMEKAINLVKGLYIKDKPTYIFAGLIQDEMQWIMGRYDRMRRVK